MIAGAWSETRSAIHSAARASLRTTGGRRPPHRYWVLSDARPSLWQLTTRPPRGRSGSQLPVEAGCQSSVRAGRTKVDSAATAGHRLMVNNCSVTGTGDRTGRTVHRTAGSRVSTSGGGRAGSRSAGGSSTCGKARGGGLVDSVTVGLGRGIHRVADRDRHGMRRPGWRPAGQGAAGGDDHRSRRPRGLTAARLERNARVWKSTRELALDPERWAVPARCERGYTEQLPDLAVWLNHPEPPVAVIVESGRRREDRQKMILKGWRDEIASGDSTPVCSTTARARRWRC